MKFLLVCTFTAFLSLGSFHYLVQRTWIGAFLHGKRLALAWPWRVGRTQTVPEAKLPKCTK